MINVWVTDTHFPHYTRFILFLLYFVQLRHFCMDMIGKAYKVEYVLFFLKERYLARQNVLRKGGMKKESRATLMLQYVTFWTTRPISQRNVSYRSVIFIESNSEKRSICSMCAISVLPVLKFSFCLFYFLFCTPALNS